mgnify:CR=1 FL=1
MAASREITAERGLAVPLRVDSVADDPAEPTSMIHCTDIEGTELRVAVQEPSATASSLETGKWYRFNRVVRSRSLRAHLLFPSGTGSVERIETPERQTHPSLAERDTPWLVQLGASDERIALTVQPRQTDETGNVRVEAPETYEIAAVCFAYCDRSGDATVYHREEPDPRDEQLLLEHVVEDFSRAEGATLVTRGYDHVPLEMLYQRLAQASGGDSIPAGAERALEGCFHATPERVPIGSEADTVVEAARQLDIEVDPVLLSDYDIGIDRADWRDGVDATSPSDASDPRMTDSDYAALVERYLGPEDGSIDSGQLGRCLKAYASADLGLLRELVAHGTMDRLGCLRLSERRLKR